MSPNDDDSGRACAQNGIKRMFNIFRNDATLSVVHVHRDIHKDSGHQE
jgi:hypothetical protein